MKETRFVYPDYKHEKALKTFVKDICEHDQSADINGLGCYNQYLDYTKWIKKEKQMHLGIHLDEGFVAGTTYLYMWEDKVIGVINIRHCLNENLVKRGGHIGYSIHPDYRQKGYATKMLSEAIEICRKWEITPILITCNKDNIASKKTIERCGGILENEYYDEKENETILRFWIGEKI